MAEANPSIQQTTTTAHTRNECSRWGLGKAAQQLKQQSEQLQARGLKLQKQVASRDHCTSRYVSSRRIATTTAEIWTKVYASALLFLQWRIGFIRRRLGFGALGFAQRSSLVLLSLFFLAPSTCRSRSLGSISSVIWLKCHCVLAG